MHLVEVDVIGAQAPQRVLDLLADTRGSGVSPDRAVAPFKSFFPRNDCPFAQTARERLADNLLRTAEPVGRGGIDQGDPALDGRANGLNRLVHIVVSAPHPPADGPGAKGDSRSVDSGCSNFNGFHGSRHPFIPAPSCGLSIKELACQGVSAWAPEISNEMPRVLTRRRGRGLVCSRNTTAVPGSTHRRGHADGKVVRAAVSSDPTDCR